MAAETTTPESTRDRLLHAASRLFAEKGYRDATVAEICQAAGANAAAVNYHFHSKENLYVEAWKQAFHRSLAAYPADGGAAAGAPPARRLQARIAALLKRILDPDNVEFDILGREMGDPTGLLHEAMREAIEPLRRDACRLIRELLGERASEGQVELCQMNVIGACLHLVFHQRRMRSVIRRDQGSWSLLFTLDNADAVAEHVTRFALAGIEEMRRQIELGRWPEVPMEHDDELPQDAPSSTA
jgi:AcrR family transcriptional regulator